MSPPFLFAHSSSSRFTAGAAEFFILARIHRRDGARHRGRCRAVVAEPTLWHIALGDLRDGIPRRFCGLRPVGGPGLRTDIRRSPTQWVEQSSKLVQSCMAPLPPRALQNSVWCRRLLAGPAVRANNSDLRAVVTPNLRMICRTFPSSPAGAL
jgi:hypothetical protein